MNAKVQSSIIRALRVRTKFLTTSEVIDILSKRRNTICKWVRDGKLEAIRIGNGYGFDPVYFADWLEARQV